MRKKLLCLLLVFVLPVCLLFTGCEETRQVDKIQSKTEESIMVVVDSFSVSGNPCYVLVHKTTRVMYLLEYNGGIFVMVDTDGKPLLYEGEL